MKESDHYDKRQHKNEKVKDTIILIFTYRYLCQNFSLDEVCSVITDKQTQIKTYIHSRNRGNLFFFKVCIFYFCFCGIFDSKKSRFPISRSLSLYIRISMINSKKCNRFLLFPLTESLNLLTYTQRQ